MRFCYINSYKKAGRDEGSSGRFPVTKEPTGRGRGRLVMARGRKDALDAVWREESDTRERKREGWQKNSCRQYVNEWAWCVPIKLYL